MAVALDMLVLDLCECCGRHPSVVEQVFPDAETFHLCARCIVVVPTATLVPLQTPVGIEEL